MRHLIIAIPLLCLLLACNVQKNQTEKGNSASSSDQSEEFTGPRVPYECNLHDYDYRSAGTGVPNMFPYVYRGAGRSRIFEAYTVSFQLTHQPPLVPMTNYEIPWINPENYSEQNGNFITYIRNGYEKSLQNPYIMVQYIRKDVPHASSPDSLLNWVDTFIDRMDGSQVLENNYELESMSGKIAQCKDYRYPKQKKREGKSLAYAYFDYNEDYIVGMVLTTVNETDYPLNKPLFEDLVKSFCY